MLIVLAIIALLIVLLLSGLNRAREMSRRTGCLSNLRQLTQAWHAYAAANEGQLCNSVGNPEWLLFDPQTPRDVFYTPVANDPVPLIPGGQLWPYLKDRRAYVCPADPQAVRNTSTTPPAVYVQGGSGTSYTLNYLLGLPQRPDGPRGVARLEQIKDAQNRMAFFEGNDGWLYNGGFACEVNSYHPSTSGSMGVIGLSFADGHAIMWTLTKWGTEQRAWVGADQVDNDQWNAWLLGVFLKNAIQ
jgi:hypothetical protein